MSDEAIRELERRLAAGDPEARLPLAIELLRAERPFAPLFAGSALVDAGVAEAARELDAPAREALAATVALIDAPLLVTNVLVRARPAFRLGSFGPHALIARREGQGAVLALGADDAQAWDVNASIYARVWWRLDHLAVCRAFPVSVAAWRLADLVRGLARELGTPWPEKLEPTVASTEGTRDTMDRSESTWSHGGLTFVHTEMMDHEHPPMESADRRASADVRGLPGETRLSFSATGNASRYEAFTLEGIRPGADEVLAAMARALGELVRGRTSVETRALAPGAWLERARRADPGDYLRDPHWLGQGRCIVDTREEPWFAVGVRGQLGSDAGSTWVVLEPLGPVPRTLDKVQIRADRTALAGTAPAPDLEAFGPLLLGEPLPRAPEATHEEKQTRLARARRFRVGDRVLQERRQAVWDAKTELTLRIQSERGDPWAFFAGATTNERGWGEATFDLVGAPAITGPLAERVRAWLAAHGWSAR